MRTCMGATWLAWALFAGTIVGNCEELPKTPIDIDPPHVTKDPAVKYDYDIVYVRSPRFVQEHGRELPARWAEFANAFNVNPGSDLMLLHPDGTEEVLVEGGAGAIQDPYVSFDGQSVYFTRFHKAGDGPNKAGADIYRIHMPTREVTRLTQQVFDANRRGPAQRYGVYNMHPCPLPGGRVAFVSSRNGYLPPPKSYPAIAMQLTTMDDDGSNVETIGHLNLAGALHPVILKDGRILFSSLENMGLRNYILWGIWSIHPDGTNWAPVASALHNYITPSSYHFQTQLSDANIVVELYYNQNQKGFGTLFKLPPSVPEGKSAFGPGDISDSRNPGFEFLGSRGFTFRTPFTPFGIEAITPWIRTNDVPAWPSIPGDEKSPRIGKVTHPCGAPDNHLLLSWTLGPIGGSAGATRDYMVPQPIDAGLYLLKDGEVTHSPGEMRLIRNDPKYNEQWPRPLVSYQRLYGVEEPAKLSHANNGTLSKELPEGTPFGLIGTSSFYKRESAPLGRLEPGSVTATFPKDYRGSRDDGDEFTGTVWNWTGQGADAGRYDNEEIHAVRILGFVPNNSTNAASGRGNYPAFSNHAMERMRILGEIPLRKYRNGSQPSDPDGNPDTSFLAKIPADVAFTFQTIDKLGMVLNMAQTWHQLRPGEIRHNCGGCHAHSQQPTEFNRTLASRPDYKVWDLTEQASLITAKSQDETKRQWDADDETGVAYVDASHDVEFLRDVQPIFARSCAACHSLESPAAGLVLDDTATISGLPGTYFRLAADDRARFSPHKVEPRGTDQLVVRDLFHRHMSSHYVWKFQSRRSLLAWKIFGARLDGWSNDDIPTEIIAPNDPRRTNIHNGSGSEIGENAKLFLGDIDYTGSIMPPPEAVAGTYKGPDGKSIKVAPLSDADKRTIVRWIDLGCAIDLDPNYDPTNPDSPSEGFHADDQRPTLTLTWPGIGTNPVLDRILIGATDLDSGLNVASLTVTADIPIDGTPADENLASKFQPLPGSRWEWKLSQPLKTACATLTVSIQDRRGNITRIKRRFTAGSEPAPQNGSRTK